MQKETRGFWRIFLKPSRLGRKFLRDFLIVGFLPLLLMGGLSVYLLNSIHRIDIATAGQNLAQQKAMEVQNAVDGVLANLELKLTYSEFAPIAETQQQFLLERLLEENSMLKEASFVCLTPLECVVGKETSRLIRNAPREQITLRDLGKAPEFAKARAGETYMGPVALTAQNVPAVIVATPTINKNAEPVAVLRAEITLEPIQTLITRTTIGKTGYAYVVDQEGRVIAHPDTNLIGVPAAHIPTVASLLRGEKRTGLEKDAIYQNLKNATVMGTGVSLPAMRWGAVVEWPRAETQEVVLQMIWNLLRFSLGTLLLTILVTALASYNLLKPITEIKEGVGTIGQGNLDYRFKLQTGDELEELGTHLNQMAVNLKAVEELRVLKLRTQVLAENLRKERDLSQLKDQFVNTVSHQFNTPLTVISWTLAAMKDPKVSPEMMHESLTKIAQSRKDMLAIVNDLLTLSEIGFHYRKTNAVPVDFKALAESTIANLRDALDGRKITTSIKAPNPNVTAHANVFAITKVIENLIDNAITYANDGTEITLELGGDEKEFSFAVRNEGIGIPAEDKGRIFQQFFRAKNAITKKNVGTGLGLFIVKTIVEGHDGRVWFESEEHKGATFHFAIPR